MWLKKKAALPKRARQRWDGLTNVLQELFYKHFFALAGHVDAACGFFYEAAVEAVEGYALLLSAYAFNAGGIAFCQAQLQFFGGVGRFIVSGVGCHEGRRGLLLEGCAVEQIHFLAQGGLLECAAQQGMLTLAQNTETETAIENLLRAKGFEDVVCYINNDMANVVVKTEVLDSANTAQITEIVTEQSGISQDKIKIMEMN